MIDTHAHLDDVAFDADREEIINNFSSDNLTLVINNSCDLAGMENGFVLAEKFDKIFCTVGMHPYYPEAFDDKFVATMKRLAQHKKVVAVGEIGLDYHLDVFDKQAQKDMFAAQLEIADQLDLPVTLHVRDAYAAALDVLEAQKRFLRRAVVWHCYSGSADFAEILVKKGWYFSFGGAITFKNAKKEKVLQVIPPSRVMSETDCPYMSPTPFRGQRNQPKMVKFAVEKMADVYGLTFQEMEKSIDETAKTVFEKLNQTQKD